MGKYFGTDGLRGLAGKTLTSFLAYKTGLAASRAFLRTGNDGKSVAAEEAPRPFAIIACDTRLSSDMLKAAVSAGVLSAGIDIYDAGICTTPILSFLTKNKNALFGVMITASHNLYLDNGIKIFNSKGEKLSAKTEDLIENYIDNFEELNVCGSKIGRVYKTENAVRDYLDYIIKNGDIDLSGCNLKIVIDLANGAATNCAPEIFRHFIDCDNITFISNSPNGLNINDKCGSTYLDALREYMLSGKYDIGIAYDGDGDRCLFVDKNGREINGDKIIALLALDMKCKGFLKNNGVACTKMTNIAMINKMAQEGIDIKLCDVGDKYVLETIDKYELSIGGEQSGHIIFRDILPGGDGIYTSLRVLSIAYRSKEPFDKLCENLFFEYPQTLINIKLPNKLLDILNNNKIAGFIDRQREDLADKGRIFIRKSGTEPVLRVLVETKSKDLSHKIAYNIKDFIEGYIA